MIVVPVFVVKVMAQDWTFTTLVSSVGSSLGKTFLYTNPHSINRDAGWHDAATLLYPKNLLTRRLECTLLQPANPSYASGNLNTLKNRFLQTPKANLSSTPKCGKYYLKQ